MMAATALTSQPYQTSYFAMLESDPRCPPGIRNLQKWVESAWKEGYDSIGAQQLKHRLVGTTKWIGTGEIYVAMTWKGIPCELVDFPKSRYSRNQDTATALIHWVVEYFSSSTSSPSQAPPPSASQSSSPEDRHSAHITMSNHMPIILQHNGHSRTIVGYELTRYGVTNLLIFDPARSIKEPLRKAALASHNRSKKRRASTFSPPPNKSSSKTPLVQAPTINLPGPSTFHPPPSFKPPPSPPSPTAPSRRAPSTKNNDDSKSIKSVKLITSFFKRNSSKHHLPLPSLKRPSGKNHPPEEQGSSLHDDPIIIDSASDEEDYRGSAKRTRGGGGGGADDIMEVDSEGFPVGYHQQLQGGKGKSRSPTVLRKAPQYAEEEDLDPLRTLNVFRVDLHSLSRHGEYQILYFPLTDPLNEQQKRDRMTVTSDRVVV
ncbi:hypothetical protein M407DRAFT_168640 [Tulasnella calospora MUT 4182]|uniref:UFSP1/2/DUB catalytic domain-containing protein n=1 Tax=Tulasnella calospora MUT 4182 TaxID=1051891 RepID=A0A0C3M762_9AGAM|nr:hypothetical protein M407DRAFT_168640 [Tulasnella calospora MUT 4182]